MGAVCRIALASPGWLKITSTVCYKIMFNVLLMLNDSRIYCAKKYKYDTLYIEPLQQLELRLFAVKVRSRPLVRKS